MANPIVKADVTAFAPELDLVAAAVWTDVLAYTNLMALTSDDDAVTIRMARIFFAAHMVTMQDRAANGSAGPVTAESSGGVRRSYGLVAQSGDPGSYTQTRYGLLYLDVLKRSLCTGPTVI